MEHPRETYVSLQAAKPEIALGFGFAKGETSPEILTSGPLWRGAMATVQQDACWHIGSITKTFTATLVMQQVDRGRLELDRPIGDYLKNVEMDASWRRITLEQLLSHTSGLAANPPRWQFNKWRDLPSDTGRKKVLSVAWVKRRWPAIAWYNYSNLGYMLAGHILEDILGTSWEAIVAKYISEPLGLSSLNFGSPKGCRDPKGHGRGIWGLIPKERGDVKSDNPSWLGPAGTIHMSIADLIYFGQAQLKAKRGEYPSFLSQENSLRMGNPISNDYGLGFVIQNDRLWHNGSNTYWYAVLSIDPVSDSVVVATQNAMLRSHKIDALVSKTVEYLRNCDANLLEIAREKV